MKTIPFFLILTSVVVLTACNLSPGSVPGNGDNSAPYNIIGPNSPQEVSGSEGQENIYQLLVDEQNGEKDPDGDTVEFNYAFVSQSGGSRSDVRESIDQTTGEFTLEYDTTMGSSLFEVVFVFWTEDTDGLKSDEYQITFKYTST